MSETMMMICGYVAAGNECSSDTCTHRTPHIFNQYGCVVLCESDDIPTTERKKFQCIPYIERPKELLRLPKGKWSIE